LARLHQAMAHLSRRIWEPRITQHGSSSKRWRLTYEDGQDNQLPADDEPLGTETVAPGGNVKMEDGHHVSNLDVLDADADANADSAMPDVEADDKQQQDDKSGIGYTQDDLNEEVLDIIAQAKAGNLDVLDGLQKLLRRQAELVRFENHKRLHLGHSYRDEMKELLQYRTQLQDEQQRLQGELRRLNEMRQTVKEQITSVNKMISLVNDRVRDCRTQLQRNNVPFTVTDHGREATLGID
jgi:hypothetical protein